MIFYTHGSCSAASASGWRCCRPCSSSRSAQAVTVPDLYETAQPVDGSRDAAFVEALKTVLVRVSGQRDAATRVGEVSDPRKYVQRFGFTADNVLEVGFDSASIDHLLSNAGLPIWGRERPATVVMFGVEDGGALALARRRHACAGARCDRESRPPARRAAEVARDGRSGARRGQLRFAGPAADGGALWSGRRAARACARRRGPVDADFRATAPRRRAAASMTACISPPIRSRACSPLRRSSLGSVIVEVGGISDLDAYAATLNYLEGMTLVRGVALEQVTGEKMRFRLAVRGDAATLRRAIALDHRLVPLDAPDGSADAGDRLAFRYQP